MAASYNQPSTNYDDMDSDPDASVPSSPSSSSSASLSDDLSSIFTSSNADDNSTTPTSRIASGQNQNLNINPAPAGGHHPAITAANNPAYSQVIASLRERLSELTVEAQRQLQDQPRQTQLVLTAQLREVYAEYAKAGSQSRLSWSLWEFLLAQEDMRTTGEMGGGELVFWSHEEVQKAKRAAQGLEEIEADYEGGWGSVNAKRSGWTGFQDQDEGGDETPKKKSVKRHPNRGFRINGEIGLNLGLGSHAEFDTGNGITTTSINNNGETPSPQASNTLNHERAPTIKRTSLEPQTIHSTGTPSHPFPTSPSTSSSPPPSYTHDADSTAILKSLPFRPADILFTFPSYTDFPGTAITYLTHLNNVVKLHNSLANALLRHHSYKYLSPDLNSTEDVKRLEHGYVILRAGIGEIIKDKVKNMFGSAGENPFGLTPETEAFLKEVYDSKELGTAVASGMTNTSGLRPSTTASGFAEHGVAHHRMPIMSHDGRRVGWSPIPGPVVANKGKLGEVEEALVGRVSRVPMQGVRGWWEERGKERLAVVGMRAFLAAREVERGARARETGTYFGWEGWGEEEWKALRGEGDSQGEGKGGVGSAWENVPCVDSAEWIDWDAIERDARRGG